MLSDFNVYDFIEQDWVPVTISYGKVNRLHQFTDDDNFQVKTGQQKSVIKELEGRYFHAMTVVHDKQFYESKSRSTAFACARSMWVQERDYSRENFENSRSCP